MPYIEPLYILIEDLDSEEDTYDLSEFEQSAFIKPFNIYDDRYILDDGFDNP